MMKDDKLNSSSSYDFVVAQKKLLHIMSYSTRFVSVDSHGASFIARIMASLPWYNPKRGRFNETTSG